VSHINFSQLETKDSSGSLLMKTNVEAVLEDFKLMGRGLVKSVEIMKKLDS